MCVAAAHLFIPNRFQLKLGLELRLELGFGLGLELGLGLVIGRVFQTGVRDDMTKFVKYIYLIK